MQKRADFERSYGELSLDVSFGVHILLVVVQSSLESQPRGCAKTPILTVLYRSAEQSGTYDHIAIREKITQAACRFNTYLVCNFVQRRKERNFLYTIILASRTREHHTRAS